MQKKIIDACKHALRHNLGIRPNESILIITDSGKRDIGEACYQASLNFTDSVKLLETPIPQFNGQEPPAAIAEEMLSSDVILMPVSKSLSWTKARMDATANGARIASMPRITEEIILRTFFADYPAIKNRVNELCDLLDDAEEIRLTSQAGTDFRFSVCGRKGHGRKGGIYKEPGHWGNLPCGEAFIAPLEGTGHGVYMINACHTGVGRVDSPIKIEVKDGRAVDFHGGAQARELKVMLESVGDPNAFNIAEFGIGCNHEARLCGITLEDEKVLGTCHIALGNNAYFGGTVQVSVHVDGVVRNPTIYFDDRTIMAAGMLL